MASFSFQSSKNLTAGEGGIITTNDDALAESCRSIHNCGRVPGGVWYEHHVISGNYRLGEFQGAVLNGQLDRLEEQTAHARRERPATSRRAFAALPGLYPQARPAECTRHSYHLFMLRLDAAAFGAPRDAVLEALAAEGIPCSGGYGFSLPRPAAVPQQGVRSVPARSLRPAGLRAVAVPEERSDLPRAVHLARARHAPGPCVPTSTTSPRRSRRSTSTARR